MYVCYVCYVCYVRPLKAAEAEILDAAHGRGGRVSQSECGPRSAFGMAGDFI